MTNHLLLILLAINPIILFIEPNKAANVLQQILPDDGVNGDHFGQSVSIYDNYAVIGARFDDDRGAQSGSVYIFKKDERNNSWTETAKLTASDGASNDRFGSSVSIYDRYVVIGAPFEASYSGSAYVFERDLQSDTWLQTAKLQPNNYGVTESWFGSSVSIHDKYAVIGAHQDESAYIFERDSQGTWTQSAKLAANDSVYTRFFGQSVSIHYPYAVIGAYFDNDHGVQSGSSYIFENNVQTNIWTQTDKLLPDNGATEDYFGISVSIYDTCAVIGADGNDEKGSEAGAVYIFEKDEQSNRWMQTQKISPDDAESFKFGRSVSIHYESIVIGAYGDTSGSAVYVFDKDSQNDNWKQIDKIIPSESYDGVNEHFGSSVSIYNKYIIIGKYGPDVSHSGSAYITLNPSNTTSSVTASTTSPSGYPSNNPTGSPTDIDDILSVIPSNIPSKQPTLPPSHIPSVYPSSHPNIKSTSDPTQDPLQYVTVNTTISQTIETNTNYTISPDPTAPLSAARPVITNTTLTTEAPYDAVEPSGIFTWIVIIVSSFVLFLLIVVIIKISRKRKVSKRISESKPVQSVHIANDNNNNMMNNGVEESVSSEDMKVTIEGNALQEGELPHHCDSISIDHNIQYPLNTEIKGTNCEANAVQLVDIFGSTPNPDAVHKRMHKNRIEVQIWLQHEVELPQYFDILVNNGYESMGIIKEISHISELKEIGIELKQHQLKFMTEIQALQCEDARAGQVTEGREIIQIKHITKGSDHDEITVITNKTTCYI